LIYPRDDCVGVISYPSDPLQALNCEGASAALHGDERPTGDGASRTRGFEVRTTTKPGTHNDSIALLGSTIISMSIRAVTFAALAALALSAWAQQGTLDKIKTSGVITIGHPIAIPFAYIADGQHVGFAIDLCARVVDAIKAELNLPVLKVVYLPTSPSDRIPQLVAGTIDMECSSATNNAERQRQVAYTMTHFLAVNRFLARKTDNLTTLEDLKGKTVVSRANTPNLKQITELNTARNLGINILPVSNLNEGLPMVESGRAAAFVQDDIMLAAQAANHANPGQWQISTEALSAPEPYGIMLRRDDPAFKKVVDAAMVATYKSGEATKLYAKWFQSPIPPKGINLNMPPSAMMTNLFANPSDSPDPAAYK
jgi:glutamate/aspartate transport system substrate-binding protein